MAVEASTPTAFERQATGLVREAGWWDVLVSDVRGWFFPGFTAGV